MCRLHILVTLEAVVCGAVELYYFILRGVVCYILSIFLFYYGMIQKMLNSEHKVLL